MTDHLDAERAAAEAYAAQQAEKAGVRVRRVELPQNPTPRQQLFLDLDDKEAFYGGAAGGAKMLPLDTPIPTPSGWTQNGDLRDGDYILDDQGRPTRIVQAFAVEMPKTAYEFTFDDGSKQVSSGEHQWLTFDASEMAALTRRDSDWKAARRENRPSRSTGRKSAAFTAQITARNRAAAKGQEPPTGSIRTTAEIAASLRKGRRANHAIQVSMPIDLPEAVVPLDPYCLGAWLGDGTRASGGFTGIDAAIWQEFEAAGFTVTHSKKDNTHHTIHGLTKALRAAGVFHQKHVPRVYLRASIAQRLALLQGLMDTDGTANKAGSVSFCNTNYNLARAAHEIVVSLGWKASITEGRAMLYGRDCGPKWGIKWTPSEYVFRLPRKRARQRLATRRTTRFRYIVDCRLVSPTPMRCLMVDSSSHLYLAGESMIPTHNSSALLMDMVKYRDVPQYSALILRRTFKELNKADAIMDRAHQWFRETSAKWSAENRRYTFPKSTSGRQGATLEFGHLEYENDKYQYQSAAYQGIAFDELTEFAETQYRFLFSRLRRLSGSDIPSRIRSASNPGGVGHEWVKNRFIPDDWIPEMALQMRVFWKTGLDDEGREIRRPFVPARLQDNPYLDQQDYMSSLAELDSVTRAQLLSGDWTIRPRGDILSMWDENMHVIGWETHVLPVLGVPHIPKHWLLSVYEDIGQTEDHPTVTSWLAKAAMNAPRTILPGSLFVYRGRCIFNWTVKQMADDTKARMRPLGEMDRVRAWRMSHERKTERIEYQRENQIPFVSWVPGKTRGIAQLRRYHEIVTERVTSAGKVVPVMHPFKPGVVGSPRIFYCVNDDELNYAKTDAGLARHRAEAPAYKWKINNDGTTPAVAIPHDLFNDSMDTLRAAAADYGPPAALPTDKEIFENRLAEEVKAPPPQDADQAALSRIIWADEFQKEQDAKKPPQIPGRAIVSVPRGIKIRFR